MFSVKPPGVERLPGLDLLRAIAILLVISYHLPNSAIPMGLGRIHQFGWIGVDLFFGLSGYLIGSQLLQQYAFGIPLTLGRFYARRSMRILPAFLVVLALYFFVPAARESPGMLPAWRFLTFSMNFGFEYGQGGAFSQAWSLCVEEHFYLFFPLLVMLLARRPSFALVLCVVIGIEATEMLIRLWSWFEYVYPAVHSGSGELKPPTAYYEYIYYPTYTRLDGLLVGVVLAAIRSLRASWWSVLTAHGSITAIGGILMIACAVALYNGPIGSVAAVGGFTLLSLGFGFLIASAGSASGPLSFTVPGARGIAALAYSLYLTHKLVIHIDQMAAIGWLDLTSFGGFLIYVVTSFVVACILYVSVERPFLRLRDRVLGEPRVGGGGARSPLASHVPSAHRPVSCS